MEIQDSKQLTDELKTYAAELDIDIFGIAGLDAMNAHGKIGRRPIDISPTAKAIVVFAVGILDPLSKVWSSNQEDLTVICSPIFNMLAIYEVKLKRFLKSRGYRSFGYAEAPGVFNVHLRQACAFQQAGLGYVGNSNLAISEKYGPRINPMTFLTDAPLLADEPYTENHCEDCDICKRFCTSNAIMGDGYYNARLCETVINCRPSNVYFSLGGWHDCDMCYRKCPQGNNKWTPEDRKGTWWDIVQKNRESALSRHSKYLMKMNVETEERSD